MRLRKYYAFCFLGAMLCSLLVSVSSVIITEDFAKQFASSFPQLPSQDFPQPQPQLLKSSLQNPQKDQPPTSTPTLTYTGSILTPTNSTTYFLSLSQYLTDCCHKTCYYGWIHNYTMNNNVTVEGFPNGSDSRNININIKPIFQLLVNGKNEYVVRRHPLLGEGFVGVVEDGVEMFGSGIQGVSQFRDANSGPALNKDYTFIPQADYYRLVPNNTSEVQPSALKSTLAASPTRISSISRNVNMNNMTIMSDRLQQKIRINRNNLILQRLKRIRLIIPTDRFTQDPTQQSPNFYLSLSHLFSLTESTSTDISPIKSYLQTLKSSQKSIFTSTDIQARRNNPNFVNFYNETFSVSQTGKKGINDTVDSGIIGDNCGGIFLGRVVFGESKEVVSKVLLGRKFAVTMNIRGTMIDNKRMRIQGTLNYKIFNNQKNIQLYDYIKDITKKWQQQPQSTSTWHFQMSMPLPTPFHLFTLDLNFLLNFQSQSQLLNTLIPATKVCQNHFSLQSRMLFLNDVEIMASVRAVGIEYGMVISGGFVKGRGNFLGEFVVDAGKNAKDGKDGKDGKEVDVFGKFLWVLDRDGVGFSWKNYYRQQWSSALGWGPNKPIKTYQIMSNTTSTIQTDCKSKLYSQKTLNPITSPSPTPKFNPNLEYTFESTLQKNMVIDVSMYHGNYGQLLLWSKHGGRNQRFKIVEKNGRYLIVALEGVSLVSVHDNSGEDQVSICVHYGVGNQGQIWEFLQVGGQEENIYYIKNGHQKYMDVFNQEKNNGARVIQSRFNGNKNQMWKVTPA